MRENIKTILVGIILLSVGLGAGSFVMIGIKTQELQEAQNDADYWENRYNNLLGDYNDLKQDHNDLTNDYNKLTNDYTDLTQDYGDLTDDYNDLEQDYNDLLTEYNILFGDYQSILSVLEDPLTNPVLPTYSELYYWLYYDDTDTYNYTSVWKCGDFSAMLMVRAKEMNWRMRISCMFWSYNGDDGWQDPTDPYGSYGHAFNVIWCQDGSDPDNELDLYYIEPQTDKIWWVNYGDNNHAYHYDIWLTFTGGITGTVWTEPYYINHYSYFA